MVKGKMYFYNKLINTNVPYRGSSVLQMRVHMHIWKVNISVVGSQTLS